MCRCATGSSAKLRQARRSRRRRAPHRGRDAAHDQLGGSPNAVYQVGGKSFVFVRNPRPDASDPETGEKYDDVIVFWVPYEDDKQALVLDERDAVFTTAHFDGHPSVLLRASRLGEVDVEELRELVEDAWLARPRGDAARRGWPRAAQAERRPAPA